MMNSKTFCEKAIHIAKNVKTLYVMGCFGAPMTPTNKTRYKQNHKYNTAAARQTMITSASADTFGFDCVCLIKGILWGWDGNKAATYGGAAYASNGVPDIGADTMITKCPNASATGWDSMVPGEVVWLPGHIGIYIGDGLAVECTPAWENEVQITAVGNIGAKPGYNTRTWKKHGKIPYVDYDGVSVPTAPTTTDISVGDKVKVLKAITYTGAAFRTYYDAYDVIQINGDRVVIGIGKVITAAVNVANISKV